jgi:hypothetical protein
MTDAHWIARYHLDARHAERQRERMSQGAVLGAVVRLPRSGNRDYRIAKGPHEHGQYLFREAEGNPYEFWSRWDELGPVENIRGPLR